MDTETKINTEKVKCPKCGYDDIQVMQIKDGRYGELVVSTFLLWLLFLFIGYVIVVHTFPVLLFTLVGIVLGLGGIALFFCGCVALISTGRSTLVCKRCLMEWIPDNEDEEKGEKSLKGIIAEKFISLMEEDEKRWF